MFYFSSTGKGEACNHVLLPHLKVSARAKMMLVQCMVTVGKYTVYGLNVSMRHLTLTVSSSVK